MKRTLSVFDSFATDKRSSFIQASLYMCRPAKAHKMHLMMGTNGIGKELRHTQSLF